MRRVLTAQERLIFANDGVVHIPGAITPEWVGRMLAAVDAKLATSSPTTTYSRSLFGPSNEAAACSTAEVWPFADERGNVRACKPYR